MENACYEQDVLKRINQNFCNIVKIIEPECKNRIEVHFKDGSILNLIPKLYVSERGIKPEIKQSFLSGVNYPGCDDTKQMNG